MANTYDIIQFVSRPLPPDETRRLIGLAQGGDIEARNRVVEANLRWVVKIVGRHLTTPLCCEPDDLMQAGTLGLMKAVERFDLQRPVAFLTYATYWIKHFIRRHLHEYRYLVRVPVYIQDAHRAGRRFGDERDHAIAANEAKSNDGLWSETLPYRSRDIDELEEAEERELQTRRLDAAMRQLDARGRMILRRRANGEILREIAESLGVTRECARLYERNALRQLAVACGLPPPTSPSIYGRGKPARVPERRRKAGKVLDGKG